VPFKLFVLLFGCCLILFASTSQVIGWEEWFFCTSQVIGWEEWFFCTSQVIGWGEWEIISKMTCSVPNWM